MITKEMFMEVYNKYPPSKLSLFFHKYFSGDNVKNKNRLPRSLFRAFLFVSFWIGFGAAVFNSMKLATIMGIFIGVLLVVVGVPWIFTWYQHFFRIRKIRRKLGLSRKEYDDLVYLYF